MTRNLIALLISVIFLGACTPPPEKIKLEGRTQGTYYAITYFDHEGRNLQTEVDSVLKAFDRSLSMWVPGSVINRINDGDTTVIPDPWFMTVFKRSQEIAGASDGAFDFTVGPLVNAWGFGSRGKMKMDSARVDSLRRLVDYRRVTIGPDGRIRKPEGVRFDFNAIAQGFAVDVLGQLLESRGIGNYLVDIGGEVIGRGSKPDGSPWVVGIEEPATDSLAGRSINARVKLNDKALATSGNYRKYYVENGMRYSHTIDPSTGYPVRHNLLSVSVLADDAATADGFATAFMVMGMEKALRFMERDTVLEAYFIYSDEGGNYLTHATESLRRIMTDQ